MNSIFFSNRKLCRTHKDDSSNLLKLALFHRQLQIMSIHYRLNLSQFQIGCTIPCFIAIQTACLYKTLSWLSGKDTGGPILYNLLCLSSEVCIVFMTIFGFGILANVHKASMDVQRKINRKSDLKRNKWFKRWLKSSPVLKIYFGGSNFLDRLTPLNLQNFAISQTVNLMLLQN